MRRGSLGIRPLTSSYRKTNARFPKCSQRSLVRAGLLPNVEQLSVVTGCRRLMLDPFLYCFLFSDRSFAPSARDTELLGRRFVTQRFRSRADHLVSAQFLPLQYFLPAGSVLLCRGLEQSTVFAPATMPAQPAQASLSFVSRFRLTN